MEIAVRFEDHAAAVSPVSSVGSSIRYKGLPSEGYAFPPFPDLTVIFALSTNTFFLLLAGKAMGHGSPGHLICILYEKKRPFQEGAVFH